MVEGSTAYLTTDVLSVTDADSPASQITYTVVRQPTVGHLAHVDDPSNDSFSKLLENLKIIIRHASSCSAMTYKDTCFLGSKSTIQDEAICNSFLATVYSNTLLWFCNTLSLECTPKLQDQI